MSRPLVSVLIPAYNAASTLLRALESVWIQDYSPLEILVVNDGSKDNTAEVAAKYADRGVRLIDLPRNLGECGAMNAGIRAAKGEFIAFLDADDEWCAGKISKQMALIADDPGMVFVTCGGQFVDPQGKVTRTIMADRPPCEGKDAWRELLAYSFHGKPCVIARRSTILEVNGFDEKLTIAGDQDMWIKLAARGTVGFVPENLIIVHETPGSLMHLHYRREAEFILPMIDRHIAALRSRLTDADIRYIHGRRWTAIGRNMVSRGDFKNGIELLWRASLLGYQPFTNIYYVFTNLPPVRLFKRHVLLRA